MTFGNVNVLKFMVKLWFPFSKGLSSMARRFTDYSTSVKVRRGKRASPTRQLRILPSGSPVERYRGPTCQNYTMRARRMRYRLMDFC